MTRIVSIHGFLGQAGDWKPVEKQVTALSPQIHFETVDLFSQFPHVNDKSIGSWARKFNSVQKNKHKDRNILLGYSLGGRLALAAAFDKPGLWDEVILVSSHPGLISEEERLKKKNSDLDWSEKFKTLSWTEVVRLWNSQPVFLGSSEPSRDEKDFSREALSTALVEWSLATQDFVAEKLLNLKPKLHWIAGEKDGKYVQLFQNLKSDGFIEDLQVIQGASHRVIFDKPKEFAEKLVQILKI